MAKKSEKWIKNCPLKKIEKKIGFNEKKIKKIKDTIDKEVENSFKFAKKSPFPNKQITIDSPE